MELIRVAATEDKHFFGTSLRGCAFFIGVDLMGFYWRPFQRDIENFFEWLFADKKTKKMLEGVPRGCGNCEM